jgi:anti-sigma B factor antagonist
METVDALRIDYQAGQARVVVRLDGELDMASAPMLQSALERAEEHESSALVIDLGHLRFMDSTGLRIILLECERCRSSGRRFALTPGSSQVQRLFAVSGVGEQLRTIAAADAPFT